MKVEVSDQVMAFIKRQAPEPRRRLRLALRKLSGEHGDIRSLEGPLAGYSRLRVGSYRIILAYVTERRKHSCLRCIFAEKRDTVYSVFSEMLKRQVLED